MIRHLTRVKDKPYHRKRQSQTLECEASHLGSSGLALNTASTQVLLVRKPPDASVLAGMRAWEMQKKSCILQITCLLQLKVLSAII